MPGKEDTGSGTNIEGLHSMPLEGGKGKMDYSSMKGEGNTSSNEDATTQPTSHSISYENAKKGTF